MDFNLEILKNKLTLISAPVSGIESANITFAVRGGSRYETAKTNGVAHFLEHMVLRGTKNFPEGKQQLAREVEKVGGILNAGTSKESAFFYVTAPSVGLGVVLPVLDDLVFRPLIREEDVEKERGVIVEEIHMYEDNPKAKVSRVIDEVIFPNHPLGRDIGGTEATVNAISQKDIASFHNSLYSPSNIVVGLAGNYSQGFLADLRETLSAKKDTDTKAFEEFVFTQKNPQFKIIDQKTEQTHFCLNFKAYPYSHPDRRVLRMLMAILGSGFVSRLFAEVREKRGLAYAIYGFAINYQDVGMTQIYAGVPNGKVLEALEVITEELRKVVKDGVTSVELEEKKAYAKGALAISLERSSALNSFLYSQQLFLGKIKTYNEICEEIDAITLDDIKRVAKDIFVGSGLNFAIVGPVEDTDYVSNITNNWFC